MQRFAGNRLKLVCAITLALGATPVASWAQDESLAALRAQLQQLQARLDKLEADQRSTTEDIAQRVVTSGDLPRSYKLPGTDTSVQFGGYLKLDLIYDRDQDQGDTLFFNGIQQGESDAPNVRLHARQSRLYMRTLTPTGWGGLGTYIEVDFFDSGGNEVFSNSRNFRVRHAYGEVGGLLAGQTWSNFMHFAAYPATVEFNGPVGLSFIRQAQLRYTFPLGPGKLALALENPEATGFVDARDAAPDITARYAWSGQRATLETGTVLRRLTYDGPNGDDSTFGYGLMLAGNYRLTDATSLMAGAVWGDGVGRYLFIANGAADGSSGIGAAYIGTDGRLKTIKARGFNVALEQKWTSKLTSSLSYGQVRGDRPSSLFPTSTEHLETIHLSNFYKPFTPLTLGFEISRAEERLRNGQSQGALRLQTSVQYDF